MLKRHTDIPGRRTVAEHPSRQTTDGALRASLYHHWLELSSDILHSVYGNRLRVEVDTAHRLYPPPPHPTLSGLLFKQQVTG